LASALNTSRRIGLHNLLGEGNKPVIIRKHTQFIIPTNTGNYRSFGHAWIIKGRSQGRQVPVIIGRRHLSIKHGSSAYTGLAAKRRTAAVKMAVVYICVQVCWRRMWTEQ